MKHSYPDNASVFHAKRWATLSTTYIAYQGCPMDNIKDRVFISYEINKNAAVWVNVLTLEGDTVAVVRDSIRKFWVVNPQQDMWNGAVLTVGGVGDADGNGFIDDGIYMVRVTAQSIIEGEEQFISIDEMGLIVDLTSPESPVMEAYPDWVSSNFDMPDLSGSVDEVGVTVQLYVNTIKRAQTEVDETLLFSFAGADLAGYLREGTNRIYLTAIDNVGNVSDPTDTITVNIDNTADQKVIDARFSGDAERQFPISFLQNFTVITVQTDIETGQFFLEGGNNQFLKILFNTGNNLEPGRGDIFNPMCKKGCFNLRRPHALLNQIHNGVQGIPHPALAERNLLHQGQLIAAGIDHTKFMHVAQDIDGTFIGSFSSY